MGDPKKHRKKYTTPAHPWRKERLDYENELKGIYGLKTKQEIYKMDSFLRRIKSQIKKLSSAHGNQAAKEKEQLVSRLKKLKLLGEDATTDAILGLNIENLMDRRFQSVVFKKGLATSMTQARQFIVHEHVLVGDKKITSPSYLITEAEEKTVEFNENSTLSKQDHPERIAASKDIKKEIEKSKLKKEPVDEDLDVPELVQPEEAVVIPLEDAEDIKVAVKDDEETKSSETVVSDDKLKSEDAKESPKEKLKEEATQSSGAASNDKPETEEK